MKLEGVDSVSQPKASAESNRLVAEATLSNQASTSLEHKVRSAGTVSEIAFSDIDVLRKLSPPAGQTKSEFFKTTDFRGPDVVSLLNEEFDTLDIDRDGSIKLGELGMTMKRAMDSGDSQSAQKLYAATQVFDIMNRFSNDEWGTETAITKSDVSRMMSMKDLELRPGIAWGVAEGRKLDWLSSTGLMMNGIGLWTRNKTTSGALLLASILAYGGARYVGYQEYKEQKQFMTDLYRPKD